MSSAQHALPKLPMTSSGALTGLDGHQGHLTFSMTAAQHMYGAAPSAYAAAAYMQSSMGHQLASAGLPQPPPSPHGAGFPWYAAQVQAQSQPGPMEAPPYMAHSSDRAHWSSGDLAATANSAASAAFRGSNTPTPPAASDFYQSLLHKDPSNFMFNGASAYAGAL